MANFEAKKFSLSDIHNGIRYANGDIPDAEAINAPIEAAAFAQTLATNTPDISEIDGGGVASVSIVPSANGVRFKFNSLKGKEGQRGRDGAPSIIRGIVASEEELPDPAELGDMKIGYCVGTSSENYRLYLQVGESSNSARWEDFGGFNVGTQIFVNSVLQPTFDATSVVKMNGYNFSTSTDIVPYYGGLSSAFRPSVYSFGTGTKIEDAVTKIFNRMGHSEYFYSYVTIPEGFGTHSYLVIGYKSSPIMGTKKGFFHCYRAEPNDFDSPTETVVSFYGDTRKVTVRRKEILAFKEYDNGYDGVPGAVAYDGNTNGICAVAMLPESAGENAYNTVVTSMIFVQEGKTTYGTSCPEFPNCFCTSYVRSDGAAVIRAVGGKIISVQKIG